MVNQEHNGSGDNVLNKYEYIIRSIQSRDLKSVIDNIMLDICCRCLEKAREKLGVLNNIGSLEPDVCLLLKCLTIKLELVNDSMPSSKNDLLNLLKYDNLSSDVRLVVTSILIDYESRNSDELARERYLASKNKSIYIEEVFFERLATKDELLDYYNTSNKFDLSEHEITGLVRGAIRVEDYHFSFELAQHLNKSFPSSNSKVLLLYTESCLMITRNQHHHYISFSKQEKEAVDSIVAGFLIEIESGFDKRYISVLTNLLNLTRFLDERLHELSIVYIDKIRALNPISADYLELFSKDVDITKIKFYFASNEIDLEQLTLLVHSIENNHLKLKDVNDWIDKGGVVCTGDDYYDVYFNLYLRVSACSPDDKYLIQQLDGKSRDFLLLDPEKFLTIDYFSILKLSDKFIKLKLPLNAASFLNSLMPDEAWVSPVFICYLEALFASEKFDLFLSKIKHLTLEDKTDLILIREAQIYERVGDLPKSIELTKLAIDKSSSNPYAWHLLLFVSRKNGMDKNTLRDIVFSMPEMLFSTYDESKITLVNEIATHVDISLAERVLVDWFVQNPDKVARVLTQIHANALISRQEVVENPYIPLRCGDGVTYSDGFENFTRILVRDVDASHPGLLSIDSPLGQILQDLQEGDCSGDYKMLNRVSPYVAAFRLAADLRSKGNDGTDAFRQFSVPTREEEFLPYFENILRRYSSKEKERDAVLENPHFLLSMRGKFTDPSDPVKGAITHLTSNDSTKYLELFNRGEESPTKVIIDTYTAVYLALMGFASPLINSEVELVMCQYTKSLLEGWIENILRDDYLSVGVSNKGLYRITSEDIKKDTSELVDGLQMLLKKSTIEIMRPVDTPEFLIKFRDVIDETVYSTIQVSIANNIPLLCIDHLMCELVDLEVCPVANTYSFVKVILKDLPFNERKKTIRNNLSLGTPVPIFYSDIIKLTCSSDNKDTYLVFKFLEVYGEKIDAAVDALQFLTQIIRNVTARAYIDGGILAGGRAYNPKYDGYVEHVFNYCCRSAMKTLNAASAEVKLAMLIDNVTNYPNRTKEYIDLIAILFTEFAIGHFLDLKVCKESLVACKDARVNEIHIEAS